jgi:hypothetical protein
MGLKDRIFSLYKKQNTKLASPRTAALLSILAPIGGLWIALRRDFILCKLAEWFPHAATQPWLHGNGDVAFFVTVLFVLGFGFALHKSAEASIGKDQRLQLSTSIAAVDSSQKDASSNLNLLQISQQKLDVQLITVKDNIESLEQSHTTLNNEIRLLTTLGLARIASQFKLSVEDSFTSVILTDAVQNPTNEVIGLAIQEVLGNIVRLIQTIDFDPVSVEYSCSLFIFYSKEKLEELGQTTPAVVKKLRTQIKFRDVINYNFEDDLNGLLILNSAISFPKKEIKNQQELILAVPSNPYTATGEKYSVLPGAAYSAAMKVSTTFRELRELQEWCDLRADYTAAARQKIMEFFKLSNVKSFISVPIFLPSVNKEEELLGVICIERSEEGIIAGQRTDYVVPLLTPIQLLLGHLLSRYKYVPS